MTERAQTWRNAAYAGIFFGTTFGIFNAWTNGWFPPASGGQIAGTIVMMLVSGAVFGLLIGVFMRSSIIPKAEDVALKPGEILVHSGLANHFLNFEGRGGRLALTPNRLVFKPHAVNLQRGELSIPRSEIESAEPVRTLGVVPNGIAVTLKSGHVERFAVNDREMWLAKLAGH